MTPVLYYENYTPVGDIVTLASCIVFLVLIHIAYINRTRSFRYLRHMIYFLMIASISDMLFHMQLNRLDKVPYALVYAGRLVYHAGLFSILWLYVLYIVEALHLKTVLDKRYYLLSTIGLVAVLAYDVLGSVFHFGFYIEDGQIMKTGIPMFTLGYVFFVGMNVFLLIRYGERLYRGIYVGILGSCSVSVIVMCVQQYFDQVSFTAATYLFPTYALLYLMHSNPYDTQIGAVSEGAFEDMTAAYGARNDMIYLMSMYMPDFDGKGRKYPRKIQEAVRYFSGRFFDAATLFQISGGHMILVADPKKDKNYKAKGRKMLDEFEKVYPKYKIDYKIVFLETDQRLTEDNDYLAMIAYLHDRMPINTVCLVEEKDYVEYLRYKYVNAELSDIQKKNDLNDPRVKVYCQPVYNIEKQRYDTAEALMRLDLPNSGMVYPDVFIPIAEKNHYIETLTRIILHKTCEQIRKLNDEGYLVHRISVNFSVYDVRQDSFCSMVEEIIKKSDIPYDQVAIELTESQNEKDFEVIKSRINELKDTGIKFYLDDFGTGYSNFERIMELPFDIIKFDRTLVSASGNNEKFRSMVAHMAQMFTDVDYAVLYEGVESEDDEKLCIDMKAAYLQGYKYSRPIPIEELTEYFERKVS